MITVSASNSSGRVDVDDWVTVLANLIAIAASPSSELRINGHSTAFKAIGSFEHGSTATLTAGLSWQSSNPGVVSIDATTGKAKGLAAGTATVSVTEVATGISSTASAGDANGQRGWLTDESLRVSPSAVSLARGKAKTLQAQLRRYSVSIS
jgi:uncharacterized protein YjdB